MVYVVLASVTKSGSVDAPQDPSVASHSVDPSDITRMEVAGRRSHVQPFAKGSGMSTQKLVMRQQYQMKTLFDFLKRTWSLLPGGSTEGLGNQAPVASELPQPAVAQPAAAAVQGPEVETAAAPSETVAALRQELHNEVVALNEAHVECQTFGI